MQTYMYSNYIAWHSFFAKVGILFHIAKLLYENMKQYQPFYTKI